VGGTGVQRTAVDHLHLGLLGGLVGSDIGDVVRIGSKQTEAVEVFG